MRDQLGSLQGRWHSRGLYDCVARRPARTHGLGRGVQIPPGPQSRGIPPEEVLQMFVQVCGSERAAVATLTVVAAQHVRASVGRVHLQACAAPRVPLGHGRVDGGDRPIENSLTAYKSTWSSGIKYCECDIALTADDYLVLCHDVNFKRLVLFGGCATSASESEAATAATMLLCYCMRVAYNNMRF